MRPVCHSFTDEVYIWKLSFKSKGEHILANKKFDFDKIWLKIPIKYAQLPNMQFGKGPMETKGLVDCPKCPAKN